MGLPVARFRVVITTCSLSLAMGPACVHALPISSKRLTTFGERRPSRVGGAFKIRLHCLRFNGSSHSSTMVVTPLRCPSASRCFQNHPSGKGHTRKGWHVATLWDLLPCVLLKGFHIGIVESTGRILTGIEVADQAVGLQVLDMLINLMERHLFICDTAPRRIPAIGDEDVDLPIATEQLRQLVFNELNLSWCHVEIAGVIAQRQDRIIDSHPKASFDKRVDVVAYNIDRGRCLPHACSCCLCRPNAEAIMMSGRKTTPRHVG